MGDIERDPNMYEVPGSRLRELRRAEEALRIATGGDSRIIRLVKERDDARAQLREAVEALRAARGLLAKGAEVNGSAAYAVLHGALGRIDA